MGCPLDNVCKFGMGAGLMRRANRMQVGTSPLGDMCCVGDGWLLLFCVRHLTLCCHWRQGIIKECTRVLETAEFTLKMRVGQSWKHPIATKLIHNARTTGGVSAIAVR